MIAVDIEVYDPLLHALGDGSIRSDGQILCVGLYDGKDNVCVMPDDPQLKDWLASSEDKIFHNGIYDISWLVNNAGFKLGGKWHDTMTRAALIDEYLPDLSLNACCKYFNVQGKNFDDTIQSWCIENGIQFNWQSLMILWAAYPAFRNKLMEYCKQDAKATYDLFIAQENKIKEQRETYDLETDLYPLIIQMKKLGIRIDMNALDLLTMQVHEKLNKVIKQLYPLTPEIINSPKQFGKYMNNLGIHSPLLTPTGAESWCADALDEIDYEIIPLVQEYKTYSAQLSKYLEGDLRDSIWNGKIHASFTSNKRDDGGTITGRFACKKPNLQNIPAREEKHGIETNAQAMRALFLPEDGCMMAAFDYSQIEALLLGHYAQGRQAETFREQLRAGADMHKIVMNLTGFTSRAMVKTMDYGFIYGMGLHTLLVKNRILFKKLADEAGKDFDLYGKELFDMYHSKFPIIRDTQNWCSSLSRLQGYITGIGGRIHHKPKPYWKDGKMNEGLYKMLNYLIQGSAAEILKNAMLNAYKDGCFNVCKLHLQVHDELVFSVPYNRQGTEAALHIKQCMINSYKDRLLVPMNIGAEVGPNWGYWNNDIWNEMCEDKYERRRRKIN